MPINREKHHQPAIRALEDGDLPAWPDLFISRAQLFNCGRKTGSQAFSRTERPETGQANY